MEEWFAADCFHRHTNACVGQGRRLAQSCYAAKAVQGPVMASVRPGR